MTFWCRRIFRLSWRLRIFSPEAPQGDTHAMGGYRFSRHDVHHLHHLFWFDGGLVGLFDSRGPGRTALVIARRGDQLFNLRFE